MTNGAPDPAASTDRRPLRLVVLISGGGRTLRNLLDRIAEGRLHAAVVGMISSRTRAQTNEASFQRCEAQAIPATVVRARDHTGDADPDDPESTYQAALTAAIDAARPDLVVLAGFLRFWRIPDRYRHRVLNIHPSLLPRFGGRGCFGMRVHEAVLAAGERESGCTVHIADNEYDHGPIVLQRRVAVVPGDTPATLAQRVFEQECEALPAAIDLFAQGRVQVGADGVVMINGQRVT